MDFITELLDSACKALSGSILVEAGQNGELRIAIRHLIMEHTVSASKERSGHSQDCLFWTAARSQP